MKTNIDTSSDASIVPMVLVGILIVIGFHHIVVWDVFGLEILKLRAKEAISRLNTQDVARMAFICQSRAQSGCLEKYQKIKAQTSSSATPYLELAQYFQNKKKLDKASEYYAQYFQARGSDTQAAFDYAKILEGQGHLAQALQYFEYAVRKTPHTQPLFVRSYVTLLIKRGQFLQAKLWIERVRAISKESVYFMEPEMKSIARQISAEPHGSSTTPHTI